MADQPLGDPAGILSTTESPLAPPSTPALNGTVTGAQASAVGTPQDTSAKDVQMADAPADQPPNSSSATPAPAAASAAPPSTNAPSPAPARTSTPIRNLPGETSGSRAASAHPDPALPLPAEAVPHGAPVRQYLNTRVTPSLLEGMKLLAKDQPKDPLRVLGEFLLQRSRELDESK
ncbi:Dpy-30-domain-containing protein [Thozetella sp. PMI_491]|nr:Dpy-30-domain-containing protein [Thozetella sp. PMI_491]